MDWTNAGERDAWRARLRECKLCSEESRTSTPPISYPRFGTGGRHNVRVCFVGQNPPSDLNRAHDGGWMLHARPEYHHLRERAELLMADLVKALDLQPLDFYVTQVAKCPTAHNHIAGSMMRRCTDRWLLEELTALNPRVVVGLGLTQREFLYDYVKLKWPDLAEEKGRRWLAEPTAHGLPDTHLHVWQKRGWVHLPHPAVVGRFPKRDSWLSLAVEAIKHAEASC